MTGDLRGNIWLIKEREVLGGQVDKVESKQRLPPGGKLVAVLRTEKVTYEQQMIWGRKIKISSTTYLLTVVSHTCDQQPQN
jgi:hypothetical protein